MDVGSQLDASAVLHRRTDTHWIGG